MMRRIKLVWFAIRYPEVYAAAPIVCRAIVDRKAEAIVTITYKDGRKEMLEYRLTKLEGEQ